MSCSCGAIGGCERIGVSVVRMRLTLADASLDAAIGIGPSKPYECRRCRRRWESAHPARRRYYPRPSQADPSICVDCVADLRDYRARLRMAGRLGRALLECDPPWCADGDLTDFADLARIAAPDDLAPRAAWMAVDAWEAA